MSVDISKMTSPELVKLRYDYAFDIYHRRVKALEAEALSREGKFVPYYVYKYFSAAMQEIFLNTSLESIGLTLNPYWQLDQEIRDYSNKNAPGLYSPAPGQINRLRSRMTEYPHTIKTKYTVYGTIEGTELHWTGSGWSFPARPTTYWPQNGTVEYQLGNQGSVFARVGDTTWKTRNPQVKKIPRRVKPKKVVKPPKVAKSKPVKVPKPTPTKGQARLKKKKETGSIQTLNTVVVKTGRKVPTLNEVVVSTTPKKVDPLPVVLKATAREALSLCARGEFELWKPKFTSPDVTCSWTPRDYSWNDFWSSALITDSKGTLTVSSVGGCASVDSQASDLSMVSERNYAFDEMTRRVDSLVSQCLPGRRNFNAFYQIGELRDLPQTIRGTLTAWRDVESILGHAGFKLASTNPKFWTPEIAQALRAPLARVNVFIDPDKALSSAYLTYKFGWDSMVQAVNQLANAPQKATKELNYLISKNGTNVTLSTIQRLPDSEWTSKPAIIAYPLQPMLPDPDHPLSQDGWRRASIRCVVNSGVQLPTLEEPILRRVLYADKMGLFPRPSDILNLIPWTWLIDWFVGLSNYLRLAEEVQGDKQLINWGMATYRSYLTSTATIGSFMLYNDYTHNASGSVNSNVVKKATATSTGTFEALYTRRVGVESLARVKLSSGYRLSDTQKTILGALISQPLSYRKA